MKTLESADRVRVLLVDDHPVVRAGLRRLLEAESVFEVVGEAGSGGEGVARGVELRPDIVVMDIVLPDESGIEATRQLLRRTPQAKVVMLSLRDDSSSIRESFAAGASGYVVKEASDRDLVQAIRHVAAGERYLQPDLGGRVVDETDMRPSAAQEVLSERELEVVRLIALGHTSHEIGDRLGISIRTAETHRAHIMRKLHLRTRADIVRHALEHGLLNLPAAPVSQ